MSAADIDMIRDIMENNWFFDFWMFFIGACFGSFGNVCIYRIPFGKTTSEPRSFCYSCKKSIAWYDNIPIFTYLLLGGKCRNCKSGYSPRYMLIEILTGLLFWLVWKKFGLAPVTPVYWLVIFGLVVGSFIDFDWRILPDRFTVGGIFAGVLLATFVPGVQEPFRPFFVGIYLFLAALLAYGLFWESKQPEFEEDDEDDDDEPDIPQELDEHLIDEKQWIIMDHRHAVAFILLGLAFCAILPQVSSLEPQWNRMIASFSGAALGFSLLWVVAMVGKAVYKRPAMGFGDVKLMGALGAFLGWKSIFFIVMVSSLLGTIVGVTLICCGKKELSSAVPFGPYIAGAGLIWIFFGPEVYDWYFNVLMGGQSLL